jgi:hypothetical protein
VLAAVVASKQTAVAMEELMVAVAAVQMQVVPPVPAEWES